MNSAPDTFGVTPTVRAALYARVSTRDRDQNPETQLVQLRGYAADIGAEPVEYIDHASGKDLNRPAWQDMMKAVRRGHVKVVVVLRIDRAFTNYLKSR